MKFLMEPCYMLLVLFIIFLTFMAEIESTSFIIKNNCKYTIWPAVSTSANSPAIGNTGFVLDQGLSLTIDAPSTWTGRFWARTLCGTNSTGKFICSVGDCNSGEVTCNGNGGNPPVTLIEFTLNAAGGTDFYDVSLVDGFNVPASITTQNGDCESIGCETDLNSLCPLKLAVRDESNDNSVIGCKSTCTAFNTDADCCTGKFNTPQTCTASEYADIVKFQCPQVVNYAYQQDNSTFTCPTGGNYFITFCPANPSPPQYIGMLCLA